MIDKPLKINPMYTTLRRIILCALVFINVTFLAAQNTSTLSTLPLIDSGKGSPVDAQDLSDQPEFAQIKAIYDKLVFARGDFRYPVPRLQYTDDSSYVASIDYQENIVRFEKNAYEVCKKYGDVAIAFLLAHELTHYYEKHAWKRGFAQENVDLQIGKDLKKIQDGVAFETEADYLGGFLAYSAGFGLFTQGDEIIKELYEKYELPDTLESYPELNERIQLTKRSAKKMKVLIDVFDMANFNFAVGQYDLAYQYYQYILGIYQSREIYNNIGMVRLMEAMEEIGKKNVKYLYPTELELTFSGSKGISNKSKEMLRVAIRHFESANNLDPSYAPAYLNKAIACTIAGDLEKANFYIKHEALPAANAKPEEYAKTIQDLNILKAIILDKESELLKDENAELAATKKTEAIALLTAEKEKGSDNASFNLDRVNGLEFPQDVFTDTPWMDEEKIGTRDIMSYLERPQLSNFRIALNDTTTFFLIKSDRISKIGHTLIEHSDSKERFGFHQTLDSFDGELSTGIKKGSSKADVIAKHKEPSNIVGSVNGEMLVYPSIIFIMDMEGKVSKMITYARSSVDNE